MDGITDDAIVHDGAAATAHLDAECIRHRAHAVRREPDPVVDDLAVIGVADDSVLDIYASAQWRAADDIAIGWIEAADDEAVGVDAECDIGQARRAQIDTIG